MTTEMERYNKPAKGSDEFVAKMASVPDLTPTQKRVALQKVLAQPDHLTKIGQGMIGPIQLHLRYEGITRSILLEDPLVKGAERVYDVLDDLGHAYFINANESEIKVTPFEGKRVRYDLTRIASFPTVKKEDLYALRVDVIAHAQDETKQDIMRKEDLRLLTLLQAAIASYATVLANTKNFLGTNFLSHTVTEATGHVTLASLYSAAATVEQHELLATRLVANPLTVRDFYTLSINDTGWKFKDDVVGGQKVSTFGEFQIQRSVLKGKSSILLVPDPKFLGMFPVMYSLDVVENNKPEDFKVGWVLDEVCGFVILNSRGVSQVNLTGQTD